MTKAKKIVAAVVAAASMSVIGITAFADAANFQFSLEGRDDRYFDVDGRAKKSTVWEKESTVVVREGDVSLANTAVIQATSDFNWPETHVVSNPETVWSIRQYHFNYPDKYEDDRPDNMIVYLLATTGDAEVYFKGQWEP